MLLPLELVSEEGGDLHRLDTRQIEGIDFCIDQYISTYLREHLRDLRELAFSPLCLVNGPPRFSPVARRRPMAAYSNPAMSMVQ